MSALLSQLEGRERRAECEKHDADLLADLRHRAAYLRQPEIADFRIGDLAQDVATELDRAHALAASHQRLKEALEAVIQSTHSHVDERDLLAELHPRNMLDIKRRRDGVETWFEGDWLSNLWAAVKNARAALEAAP